MRIDYLKILLCPTLISLICQCSLGYATVRHDPFIHRMDTETMYSILEKSMYKIGYENVIREKDGLRVSGKKIYGGKEHNLMGFIRKDLIVQAGGTNWRDVHLYLDTFNELSEDWAKSTETAVTPSASPSSAEQEPKGFDTKK